HASPHLFIPLLPAFLSHNLFHLLEEPSPSFPPLSQDYWEFTSVSAMSSLGRRQVEGSNGGLEEEEEEEEEEVWPVEHPMEPMDEDRPVICPIPTSSLLPQEGRSRDQNKKVESWRKRAGNPVAMVAMPIMINNDMDRFEVAEANQSIGVVRKRHHSHINQKVYQVDYLRNHHSAGEDGLRRMATSPLPSNNNVANTIFHMLQRAP
ncbi:unnamed protein product, partial [Linum tenue]